MTSLVDTLSVCVAHLELDEEHSGPKTPRKLTFNEWEADFIRSVQEHYDEKGFLSEAQQDKLQELYDKC